MSKRVWKIIGILVLFYILVVLATGCSVTSRKRDLNSGLFNSPNELYKKSLKLKPGMTEKEFFTTLEFKPDPSKINNFEFLDAQTIWLYRFGNSLFQPQDDFPSYIGYRFPYASVRKLISPAFAPAVNISLKGYDLKLISIFKEGKLILAKLEGRAIVDEKETVYIWDLFGNTFEGGFHQGGREALKAIP